MLTLAVGGVLPTAFATGASSGALAQCTWAQEAKVTALDAAAFDVFGGAVAVNGDTLIVGAIGDDASPFGNVGAAYVFVRSGTMWSQQAKLTASDGAGADNFGMSVAIHGDTAVVGAWIDDHVGAADAGSAYVFVRTGTTWSQQAKLVASDFAQGDVFGISVGIDGDSAVIGARDDDGPAGTNQGSAYVFVRSGTVWTEQAKLIPSDAMASDLFGTSVAISIDTVAVGARQGDAAQSAQGTAYVFVRSGTAWSQQAELAASDGLTADGFGISVDIDGDTAVVGSDQDDGPGLTDQGSAYVFVRSGTTWSQQAKLIPADAAAFDRFGYSVGIDGDRAVVGAYLEEPVAPNNLDEGAAYVFSRSGTTWTEEAKLKAMDAAPGDQYGRTVGISGDTAVAGAWMDDGVGTDSGSAYVHRCAPPCCRGDMDLSMSVDVNDIPQFETVLVTGSGTPDEICAADVNGDGTPDGKDVQAFADKLLSGGTCP
jgi:hypothetical protein